MLKRLLIGMAVGVALSACGDSSAQKSERVKDSSARQEQAAADEAAVMTLTLDGFRTRVMAVAVGEKPKFLGKRPCVIDFYATWCGPCRQMAPTFASLASRFSGKVDFYRVDVDSEEELAGMFGVQSIPMFVYINANGEVNSSLGAIAEAEMVANINNFCLK